MDAFSTIPPPFPCHVPNGNEENDAYFPDSSRQSDTACTASDTSHQENDDISLMEDESTTQSGADIREKIDSANMLKEKGTEQLKLQNYKEARNIYKNALSMLGDISDSEKDAKEDFKKVQIALHSNLSLCHIKLEEWIDAIHACSDVIKSDQNNAKAYYRRGFARTRIGFLEEAKDDLLKAYNFDSTNVEIMREIQNVKRRLIEARQDDKKKFGGLFEKAQGLYTDRNKQVDEKKKKELEQKQKEEKLLEAVNSEREAQGQPPFKSVDEWRASENKTESKSDEKPKTSTPKEKNKSTDSELNKPKPNEASTSQGNDALDLDEEDREILKETKQMGYCYFNRKVDGSQPVARRTPEKIEVPQQNQTNFSNNRSLSSWNAGGTTYEERDCTRWFQKNIEDILATCAATLPCGYKIKVCSVDSVSCEAHVVVLRASKRYLYDCSCTLNWELASDFEDASDKDSQTKNIISGKLQLNDMSSAVSTSQSASENLPEWLTKATHQVHGNHPNSTHSLVKNAISALRINVYEKVRQLENEFKQCF